MVPISKSIWQDAPTEYRQRIFIAFTANFLSSLAKTFSGTGQNRCRQTFRPVFVQVAQSFSIFSANRGFSARIAAKRKAPSAEPFQRRVPYSADHLYICLYILCHAFWAAFFVAWRKTASIAMAKITPMGYATAVL